jgi:hypothetical protein
MSPWRGHPNGTKFTPRPETEASKFYPRKSFCTKAGPGLTSGLGGMALQAHCGVTVFP